MQQSVLPPVLSTIVAFFYEKGDNDLVEFRQYSPRILISQSLHMVVQHTSVPLAG